VCNGDGTKPNINLDQLYILYEMIEHKVLEIQKNSLKTGLKVSLKKNPKNKLKSRLKIPFEIKNQITSIC
jgi:hypothetical protein